MAVNQPTQADIRTVMEEVVLASGQISPDHEPLESIIATAKMIKSHSQLLGLQNTRRSYLIIAAMAIRAILEDLNPIVDAQANEDFESEKDIAYPA